MLRIPDFSNRIFTHFFFSNKAAHYSQPEWCWGPKEVVGGARCLQNIVPKREKMQLLRLVNALIMGTRTSPVDMQLVCPLLLVLAWNTRR